MTTTQEYLVRAWVPVRPVVDEDTGIVGLETLPGENVIGAVATINLDTDETDALVWRTVNKHEFLPIAILDFDAAHGVFWS